jgi:hypothetical protein
MHQTSPTLLQFPILNNQLPLAHTPTPIKGKHTLISGHKEKDPRHDIMQKKKHFRCWWWSLLGTQRRGICFSWCSHEHQSLHLLNECDCFSSPRTWHPTLKRKHFLKWISFVSPTHYMNSCKILCAGKPKTHNQPNFIELEYICTNWWNYNIELWLPWYWCWGNDWLKASSTCDIDCHSLKVKPSFYTYL